MMKNNDKYYPSNTPGTKIKNAITGLPYENCYVGTPTEKSFYRVIDSTGNYNSEGFKINGNPNSNKLFFESYSEFKDFYKIGKRSGYKFLNDDN